MQFPRSVRILPLLAALAACSDVPTGTPPTTPEGPRVVGLYEFTITGIGSSNVRTTATPVGGGPSKVLSPRSGFAYELVSSSSVIDGLRGEGGTRYVSVTYRVRNATGSPVSNLTLIPAMTTATISGTPFTALSVFNGGAADPALAGQFTPTGAVTMGAGSALKVSDVDVLQVFQESEVAGISLPVGVTGLFPYGFVVRSINSGSNRTLPAAVNTDDFGGLLTFAFRYPLTASANTDPFTISFQAVAVEDSETRVTETMEDAQDTSAVRLVRARAAALGATTVTVLAGSPAAAADVTDYPGQRQICFVRTAGVNGAATSTINRPGPYARINLLRQGESANWCDPYFRTGTPQSVTPGAAHTFTAVASDRYGNVLNVADDITLTSVAGPSATIGAGAALVNGQAGIQVTFNGSGTALLRANGRRLRIRDEHWVPVGAGSAASMEPATSDWFTGMAGAAVTAPAVLVRDAQGNPLAGQTVNFEVSYGGGQVTGASAVTNAGGVATVGSWTLGAMADLNVLTATVSGADPVDFYVAACTATAAGYSVSVCFTTPVTSTERTAFLNAAARWQGAVTSELSNVAINVPAGECSDDMPALNMTVDDLLIYASVYEIDGVGGILGQAGPCLIRNSNDLPIIGVMAFDADDMASMSSSGQLSNVIVHEMGHVLGIGSMWGFMGLLGNPSTSSTALDTYFTGANALVGFNNVGGSTYTGGAKVPVENTGGAGTMNAHWRESVLANELMTGYLNAGSNPLSELTIRSLIDMGYTVNTAAADPFFRSLTLRADGPTKIRMMNDVRTGPIRRVDASGRIR